MPLLAALVRDAEQRCIVHVFNGMQYNKIDNVVHLHLSDRHAW